MSTTQKVAHNTIIQISGKIVSTILGLLAIGMMTRYLGQEQFGWYVTTVTFLSFIAILIDFGLIPATAQMLSEPAFDKKKLFQNLLGFRFTTAVVFLGIAPLIALLFPYPNEVKIAIAFTTFSFLGVAMNQVLIGLYQTKLKMQVHAIAENVGRVVLVGGLWYMIQGGQSFLAVMAVTVVANLSFTAYFWFAARKETPVGLRFDMHIWKAIIIKMWPIAIAVMFNVVYLKGDTLLLSLFSEQEIVGIYGAAYRVVEILSQIAMMIMGVMLPLLTFAWSRGDKPNFFHRLQLGFDMMMLFAIPITAGVITLAAPIMTLVAGPEFSAAGAPLAVLAIAVFGVYLGAVFGHTAVAINKQKQTLWIYISNAIITLIGYLYFIPKFGMMGAAWMTVFSEAYTGILLYLVLQKWLKRHLRFMTFLKMIFSAIVMSLVILYTPDLHVLIRVVIGAAVYGFMILATRAISKETLVEILSIKKK